jgi:WD40 repeat protein
LAPPRTHVSDLAFSSDGAWLASIETFEPGEVHLVPAHGGDALHWQVHSPEREDTTGQYVWFSFVSDAVLATFAARDPVVRLWSVPEGRVLQTLPPYGQWARSPADIWREFGTFRRLARFSRQPDGAWIHDTRGIDRMAKIGRLGDVAAAVDGSGELLAYQAGGDLVVENLGDPSAARRLVGRSEAPLQHIAWSPSGDHIATWQPEAGMALWSLGDGSLRPHRTWTPDELLNLVDLAFDPTGVILTAGVTGKNSAYVWDLAGPPAAEPWRWARKSSGTPFRLAFDPTSSWLAAGSPKGVALWRVERGRYPYLLRGHTSWVRDLAFAPDGSWLVSSAEDGTVRWWPLTEAAGAESRVLFDWGRPWVRSPVGYSHPHFIAVAPDGAWVAVTGEVFDTVHVVSVGGGEPRELRTDGEPLEAVAVDPGGRRLAVGAGAFPELGAILIWDLESDAVTRLEVAGSVADLQFLPDGSLLDVVHRTDRSTIGRWNLATLERDPIGSMLGGSPLNLSAEGRYHLRMAWDENGPFIAFADLVGGTSDLVSRNPASQAMDLSPSGSIAVGEYRRVPGGGQPELPRAPGRGWSFTPVPRPESDGVRDLAGRAVDRHR